VTWQERRREEDEERRRILASPNAKAQHTRATPTPRQGKMCMVGAPPGDATFPWFPVLFK
jgi:hypothetical protein